MPTTIEAKINEIKSEPSATTLMVKIQPKVRALILSMVQTDEWRDFVSEFIDDANSDNLKRAQLDRLILADSLSVDPYIVQSVAYLFANSVCGGTTRGKLNDNINGILDTDIDLNQ
jgi:hypothetical protein